MPNPRERGIRINSVASGLALADLQELAVSPQLSTILLPKCDSAGDLAFVRDIITHVRPASLPMLSGIALVESAKSLINLNEICRAAPELLSGLAFAAEDFCADLGITRTSSMAEMLFARSSIVTAARAHNLQSTFDLVTTGFKSAEDQQQLASDARDGRCMGFSGKQCIHPSQIEAVNSAFTPNEKEVEWAVRVAVARKRVEAQGIGAWTLDGKMIDRPVEQKAMDIVRLAKLCGLDVETLEKKHASQAPE